MIHNKPIWIADNINYPTTISQLEKIAISTANFNRLHNVLENSTVYFTYPANRTSRFIHSLGCMKNAGDIFRVSILNAERKDRDDLFEDLEKEVEIIRGDDLFVADVNTFTSRNKLRKDQLDIFSPEHLNYPLYNMSLPGNVKTSKSKNLYILLFQAIRLAALFHDMGHPPFSHVVERAIDSLYLELREKKDKEEELNERQKHCFELINNFVVDGVFHEHFGNLLTEKALKEVLAEIKMSYDRKFVFFSIMVVHLALRILKECSHFSKSLHKIIASDMDSDRLDYVSRDMVASGISQVPHNYERLINSYRLIYLDIDPETHDEKRTPLFVPSVRALSTIEEFYLHRFNLWKYIIFHHRVVKTDALVENITLELSREYISIEEGKEPISEILPVEIRGLWEVLEMRSKYYPEDISEKVIQWDDPWLLSVLRKNFIGRKISEKGYGSELIDYKLEEIITNKKNYFSLFKRVDSFVDIDNAFTLAFNDEFDWVGFGKYIKVSSNEEEYDWDKFKNWLSTPEIYSQENGTIVSNHPPENTNQKGAKLRQFKSHIEMLASSLRDEQSDTIKPSILRERNGLSIIMLGKLLISTGKSLDRSKGLSIAKDVADKLKQSQDLDDVLLIYKNLKPGVSRDFLLESNGEPIPLGNVSNIVDLLERSAQLFPPFYLYIFKQETMFSDADLMKLRKEYGKLFYQLLSERVHFPN